MPIQFTDDQINRFASEGLAKAVTEQFTSRWGHGEALTKAIQKAIAGQEALIADALKHAITQACLSPAFQQAVTTELVGVVRRKFTGEFDGVVKAAAKRAAQDNLVAGKLSTVLIEAAVPNQSAV